jgi:hypothetical protein
MPFHATWGKPFAPSSHGEMQRNLPLAIACPFIISPCIHLFMFQTLILLEANDIWVHTWANENFEKPCLLDPWRWSHLGQQHKGPLYVYRLGLKLSRISSVSPMCQKEPKSCCSPLNSSRPSSSRNFEINKQCLNISLKLGRKESFRTKSQCSKLLVEI